MMPVVLPFDVLFLILEFLLAARGSKLVPDSIEVKALYNCSLANRELSLAARRILYRSVRLHFPWKENHGDENDCGLPTLPHPFLSALSPNNHLYVQHFEISGYISTLPPSDRLSALLASALKLFTSPKGRLQSLRFTPENCHPETFTESLIVLSEPSQRIRELHLNQWAFDHESKVQLLARIGSNGGLKILTLENPTRVLLQALVGNQGWLAVLQRDLAEFHLTNNCGSITPGVLHSFLPYLWNLEALTLGLSYSLADKDVFGALAQLPRLKRVGLRWYLQHNSPPLRTFIQSWPLQKLELLEVRFSSRSMPHLDGLPYHVHGIPDSLAQGSHHRQGSNSKASDDHTYSPCPLCSWVAKAIAGSPILVNVTFLDEDEDSDDEDSEDMESVNDGDETELDMVTRVMRMRVVDVQASIIEEEEED